MINAKLQKFLDNKYNYLSADIDDVDIADPPKDDSHTTRMELEEVDKKVKEKLLPPKLIQAANADSPGLFHAIAKKNNLDPLEKESKELADDWTKFSLELKLKYKRRRPIDVMKEHEVDFVVHKSDTTESPSYPSGHAMVGYGLAEFYKAKYPYLSEEWDNLADIIAHSRLQMGVHYPSDVKASKEVVEQTKKLVKTSSERLRTTIFGVDPEGKLLHGFGGQGFYKFPGGGVDSGESVIDAAKRELLEEAGYDVESIEELPGLDTTDAVGASSAKGHMGHGSSRTKYLLARLGKRNESLLGSEGDAIANLQTAPIDEVLQGLEGDMLFGSGVAQSNYDALSKLKSVLNKTAESLYHGSPHDLEELVPQQARSSRRSSNEHKQKAVYLTKDPKEALLHALMSRPDVGSYGIQDGLAYYPEGRPLNDMGYVYKVDVDNYVEPKDPKAGIAYGEKITPVSREEVFLKDHLDKLVAMPNKEAYKAKIRELLSKTAEEQPLLRHRSTLLIRDPETGKLLAAKNRNDPRFDDASPYYFPGGGLYDDEYDTPRTPTEEEILKGARREALEELGIGLTNPRVVGGSTNMLPKKWRQKVLERRGVPYLGGHEHLVLADKGEVDSSLYNVEGDAFTEGDYFDPEEVYNSLLEYGDSDGQFAPYNREQARAIKEHFLKKNASDLSVITEVPKQNLDLIMRKGLASQKAISEDPELTEAFLKQRGLKEEDWRKELAEGLKGWKRHNRIGPSVFFTDHDPSKVSDPRHFINQFDTTQLRVNLSKLLKDIPETRFHGVELEPFNEEAWEADPDNYYKRRHRDLTTEEIAKYIATDPKEMWKHYKEEYLGKLYAGDVPHGMIITPSGIIPPEYLERVEKTSEAKPDLNNFIKYIEEEARKRGVKDMHVVMSHPDHPLGGGSAHYTTDLDKDSKSALLVKALRGKMREWEQQQGLDPDHDWDKTSSAKEQLKHILVTGHSGAGKTTYARQLAEQLGMPLHRLDVPTGPMMEERYPNLWDQGTLGFPEDVTTDVIQQALDLDKPHVIEGSHILEIPELTEGYKRILIDTPEDRVVEQRAQREYRNQGRKNKPYRPIEKHREAAQELVDHYRDIVTNFRNQPGVESIVPEVKTAQEQLKHILITGQSGSGKTTEAKRLAKELSMPVVHLDEQKGFGPKGIDPDYIEDLTKATQDIIGNLDKPHIVEGTQLLSEQFPIELLRSNELRILEADEDELVKRLTGRGWNTESGRDLKGPESADEARHVTRHQRKSVDKLVERLKKKAALEAEFLPDFTPEDLVEMGVYDQVYGDAPSEASMKEWPEHWINKQDPLGWLQWYDRYSKGRRTEDDARQIKRWKSFKARHLAQYLKNPTLKRKAALRNWAIDVEK